jgi:protein gp37
MAESQIEWTDATWNPVAGCSIISAGCTNCYAMEMARRLDGHPGVALRDLEASRDDPLENQISTSIHRKAAILLPTG